MEFARFHAKNRSQIILLMANWPDYGGFIDPNVKSMVIKTYWLNRLTPLAKPITNEQSRNVYFLNANRTGSEFNNKFIGSSCVFQLQPKISFLNDLECS